jgi:aryl-alcohol dehydrogenase-like predicted oxidoreductase
MRYRAIGQTDLSVSEVSLGCWTLGGRSWSDGRPTGWKDVDEAEAVNAVHHALDRGVNHFDNADAYGDGHAERLLARALGSRSNEVVIASKVGHLAGSAEHAYDPLHIRHQCEQSLRNLGRDFIDLYYFHHGDFGENDRYLDDALAMMHQLREEGKIRYIGLSAYSEKDFERLVPVIRPVALQSWANAMDTRHIAPGSVVARLCKQYGISFVAFSPLARGRLLGKYSGKNPPSFPEGDIRRTDPGFSAEALGDLEGKIEQLKQRFGDSVPQLAAVALRFLLAHEQVACVIPGFRNLAQVECNLGAAKADLSTEEVRFVAGLFDQATI